MRNNIDYGIDLGTTNSAIAKMENGVPTIIKADNSKDILPSCVRFTPKKTVMVGELAVTAMQAEMTRTLGSFDEGEKNSFIEFKRTMGTTAIYKSSNMGKDFSSEELSAEVLKTLKSFEIDENLSSIVITVPAKFLNPQKEATIQAAKLAGFQHIELLQEPVAAAIAYGLTAKDKDSYWLVFDFGGGTFDAALIKSEEGILTVKDTDGDQWLGGKNLDYAIVDQIIIPYLKNNYALNSIWNDERRKQMLRDALKQHAEIAKNQMSFKNKWAISIDLGFFPIKDDNDNDIEIDREVTGEDMENVLAPIFQKAIDITKGLLKRNNLKGTNLGSLILVGGPTHSPILRRMLKEQITENVDTSVDPMTVVAKGAALFASTISVSEEVKDIIRDKTKIQLGLKYNATSVETEETISLRILKDKTEGAIPEKVFADIVRSDGAWSSGKQQIGEKSVLFNVLLQEECANLFTVNIYDEQGNNLECEPKQFSIIAGVSGVEKMSTLPFNIGIGKWFDEYEKDLFVTVNGLEKNKKLPATGVINGLKTRTEIRPGMAKDIIRIPIYQGNYNVEGTNPLLNNLVNEVIISGESLPALLPEGSDVDITIKVDRSEQMLFSAYFPLIEHTEESNIEIKKTESPAEEKLKRDIDDAKRTAKQVNDTAIFNRLEELTKQLENEKGSADGKLKILDGLRKELLQLDPLEKNVTWLNLEQELKKQFFDFEDVTKQLLLDANITGRDKIKSLLEEYRKKVEIIIREKKKKEAKELASELFWAKDELIYDITEGEADIYRIQYHDENFNNIKWKDTQKARQLVNLGLQYISQGETRKLRNLLHEIWKLRVDDNDDKTTLEGGY